MSACAQIADDGALSVGSALRGVDCLAAEMTSSTFGRLFGAQGMLSEVLTILLTLYIAFFAISLLTGRSRLGISALTPRVLTLGMVLTFATSWVAYQSVVWNLAVGGPDQLAGILTGDSGLATQIFGDRIDMVFNALSETATNVTASAAGAPASPAASMPTNLLWLAAVLLMLGTVGVLVTARIALAGLLALGPVFIVLALFKGTRGLFVGWLRAVVLTAFTPLFAVIGGTFTLKLIVPIIAAMQGAEGLDIRAAMALFLISAVHIALMAMMLRVVGTIISSWNVFGLAEQPVPSSADGARSGAALAPPGSSPAASVQDTRRSGRAAVMQSEAHVMPSNHQARSGFVAASERHSSTHTVQVGGAETPPLRSSNRRAQGVGSAFRSSSSRMAPRHFKEIRR
ncbi:MAG: type IV secretion system protein [Novosphingobium sp.]